MDDELNIFNIQRFSLHDGPGIRTAVFLKGCTMHCQWCHNPESIPAEPLVCFYPDKCINCQKCRSVCDHLAENNLPLFQNYPYAGIRCFNCGLCVDKCPAGALVFIDKFYGINEVYDVCVRDEVFYKQPGDSRGGITFSGGEPLLQAGVLRKLMKKLKESDIHCAIETAGFVDFTKFESILPFTDLFLFDLKIADDERHRHYTGVPNRKIIENLYAVAEKSDAEIHIRIPVIEGVNADEENMRGIAKIISPARDRISKVELMPYHRLGEGKYKNLRMISHEKEFGVPGDSKIAGLYAIFNE